MNIQTEIICLDALVSRDHPYRKLLGLIDFEELCYELQDISNNRKSGRKDYTVVQYFKMLLLQYMEDLSDRELERFLRENLAAKLFCDFNLTSKTPDHSLFGYIRNKIGTTRLADIFNKVREGLRANGLIREIFTFVDSSQLISKINFWHERDKLIKEGIDKFNNEVIKNKNNKARFQDNQARFGCKGNKNYWYGYKRHVSLDMQSGLINKIAITSADKGDDKTVKHILPNQGAIYGDKGYCTKYAKVAIAKKNLHNCTIKKNNMIGKDKDKDRWISKIRSPYERVFSKTQKHTYYRGIAKNQFAEFMRGLAFNFKRLIIIEAPPIKLS